MGPGNGLSPIRSQDITLTTAELLPIEPLGKYLSEVQKKC